MKQVIAHVDMDCFFAAVEEKYDPELKGKPVIIGSLPTDKRGVVSTANYTAREYGVGSAMPIKNAYKLCPNGVYIRPDMKKYSVNSREVMEILSGFTDTIKQVSVDEAYLDITEFVKNFESYELAARAIKKAVFKKTRLTCSIGIAESKHVAKIGSDLNKPAGTTVILDPKEQLGGLSIKKIPGIGKVTQNHLENLGIKTIGDLGGADKFLLLDHFGKHIIKYRDIANGLDTTGLDNTEYVQQSVSRETTFPEDVNVSECFSVIPDLAKYVHNDLHNVGYKRVSIKVRYSDFRTITRDFSLNTTRGDLNSVIVYSEKLLRQNVICDSSDSNIRLFGIKLSGLEYGFSSQRSLLEWV